MDFDLSLAYQTTIFFQKPLSQEIVASLPALIGASVDGQASLGLKFGPPRQEPAFELKTGFPVLQIAWGSSLDVWKLLLSPGRLDIHFNARGHAEVTEQPVVKIEQMIARVLPNLLGLMLDSVLDANRLSVILTGMSSCQGDRPAPVILAERFFNSDMVRNAHQGLIASLHARIHHRAAWDIGSLSGPESVSATAVNLLEVVRADPVEQSTSAAFQVFWQAEANTSTEHSNQGAFDQEAAIRMFYARALAWLTSRYDTREVAP